MKKNYVLPSIITIIIVLAGVMMMFQLYSNWKNEPFTINNPLVDEVVVSTSSMDLKTIIHEAEKSVIQIEAQNENATLTGSGFLLNDKGDIITNAHVIESADAIYVRTSNARIYPAAVVGIGDDTDIAVIRVPQLAGLSTLSVAEELVAETGDEVIALGSPHGFQNTVTLGIISGTQRNFSVDGFDYSNVYQISAQITHGNSGGPLIHRETGQIIGINSVGTQDGTIGFSIPLAEVYEQINQWSNEAQNDQLDFASISDIIENSDTDQAIEGAEYVVEYYLESISIRDYVGAYSLLGSTIQQSLSYKDFRNRYVNVLKVSHNNLESSIMDDGRIEVAVDVTTESNVPNKEETEKVTEPMEFIIGHENDQIKILGHTSQ